MLASAPRSASVTAIEPCLLLRLRRGPFEELLDDRPEIARGVIATLVRLLQASNGDGERGGRRCERRRRVAAVPDRTDPAARRSGVRARAHPGVDRDPGDRPLPRGVRPGAPAGDLHRRGVRRRACRACSLTVAFRRRPLGRGGSPGAGRRSRCSSPLSWVLLGRSGTEWVSFALLVLVPIVVPVGFMFVVGQAGMLLDVRTLKALYARVVAGFALGVVVGGLVGPILLDALGETADLLSAAAAAAGLLLRAGGRSRSAPLPGRALRGRARRTRHTSDRRSARCPATAS